jgi:hypothetical protein
MYLIIKTSSVFLGIFSCWDKPAELPFYCAKKAALSGSERAVCSAFAFFISSERLRVGPTPAFMLGVATVIVLTVPMYSGVSFDYRL